jgi:hypothetical protein
MGEQSTVNDFFFLSTFSLSRELTNANQRISQRRNVAESQRQAIP